PPPPRVARHAAGGPQLDARERLTDLVGMSPHDERDPTAVARSRRQGEQRLLEKVDREMTGGIAGGSERGVVGGHRRDRYSAAAPSTSNPAVPHPSPRSC